MKNKELDKIMEDVAAGIQSERLDDRVVANASQRVWARLENNGDAHMLKATGPETAEVAIDHIEGCADFQSLIPAYLKGNLSEARSLLLVDHTHECIPCRRALKQARERRVPTAVPVRRQQQQSRFSLNPVIARWGTAAALLIGLG